MDCHEHALTLGDLVDGTADPGAARAAAAHLAACAPCRALVDDLARLRLAARTLETPVPPPHAWPRLAAALEAERQRTSRGWLGLGLTPWGWMPAAAALALIVGGLSWVGERLTPDTLPARTIAGPTAAPRGGDGGDPEALRLAETEFTQAIAGLEAATQSASTIDPLAADDLRAGVAAIDAAIGESRAALAQEPANALAQEALLDALRSKVALLQDTVALIDDQRDGPAGLGAPDPRELRQ
jgi:hypothetical protein